MVFADDGKILTVIDDASDQLCFDLHQWSTRNATDFNVKQCKIMTLTRKRQPLVSNYNPWIIPFLKKLKNSKTYNY